MIDCGLTTACSGRASRAADAEREAREERAVDDDRLPEDVLFDFLIANLGGSEEYIRPLIVDHPDAALLWQGAYSPDVAALLAQQYEGMGIARVEEQADRVLLQSSASPIPLAVLRINGVWRVDASPIIEFRKRAQKKA
jgi:hypothetical protein